MANWTFTAHGSASDAEIDELESAIRAVTSNPRFGASASHFATDAGDRQPLHEPPIPAEAPSADAAPAGT